MHSSKFNNKGGTRAPCPALSPWAALRSLACIALLVNGCANNDGMEFHPNATTAKTKFKRDAGPTPAVVSKTNLSTAPLTLQPTHEETRLSVTNNNRVITLADPWAGKVASVNQAARFVILDYSLSQMPPVGQRLGVYRKGVRIGEIRISGQPQDGYVAADITAGEILNGDETRRE